MKLFYSYRGTLCTCVWEGLCTCLTRLHALFNCIRTQKTVVFEPGWSIHSLVISTHRAHPEDKTVFPIPLDEITYNPNLIQNEGY